MVLNDARSSREGYEGSAGQEQGMRQWRDVQRSDLVMDKWAAGIRQEPLKTNLFTAICCESRAPVK